MKSSKPIMLSVLLAGAGMLAGCGGDESSPQTSQTTRSPAVNAMRMFSIEVVNLTHQQPLSPVGIVVHEPGYMGWQSGSAASVGLEKLAEGGSPADWLGQAAVEPQVEATAAGTGAIIPGQSEAVTVSAPQSQTLQLTLASMLVHTNDGFTGVMDVPIGDLQKDASKTVFAPTYDAGTEANSETSSTIPGPDLGGEGFNPARDDRNFVAIHPGVLSMADGLVSSNLTEAHRFQNTSAKIVITRLQ